MGALLKVLGCSRLQNIRFSSAMFGATFPGQSDKTGQNSTKKNILYLNASHGDKSLVAQGAKTFLENLKFDKSVEEVNIWKTAPEIQYSVNHAVAKMRILNGEGSEADEELFGPVLKAASEINRTDLVLISTPMWNYSVPYPLKQYIDTIVQPGINFCDESQSSLSSLRGRHLVVFSSAGAVYHDQSHNQDFLNPYLGQVFRLMGFDSQEFVFIEGTSSKTAEDLVQFTKTGAMLAANNVNKALL